jgi:hypothetical protein
MERIFEHYHLSLIENDQGDLLVASQTREQWLRAAFSATFVFRHHGKAFHWVRKGDHDSILGIVERQKARTQHRAPEDGATEFEGHEWQGSIVVIDPVHRPDGQKVAFERDRAVGLPSAILDSLVVHLNSIKPSQYTIVIRSLFDADSFRAFAARHGQLVRYINFNFVVPNMFFGTSGGVDQGLKRIGTNTGAQTVQLRIASEDGVKADSSDVESAMAYAEAGNAEVTAKAMNGDLYASTRRRLTIKMQSILSLATDTTASVQNWIGEALGRVESAGVDDLDSGDSDASDGERVPPVLPKR